MTRKIRPKSKDKYGLAIGIVGIAALLAYPYSGLGNDFTIGVVLTTMAYIILGSSWNLFCGYSGYISFGHVAFFGVGAYTSGLLMVEEGLGFLPAVVAGGILAAAVALPLAAVTIRLEGVSFAIILLVFAEFLRQITRTAKDTTGGANGLSLPPVSLELLYMSMIGLLIVTMGTTYLVTRSKVGFALQAIRDDESAARSIGVNTRWTKITVFVLSGFFTGLAGALIAPYWTFLTPSIGFSVQTSAEMMIMAMLGGLGTIFGPIIGAIVVSPVSNELSAQYPYISGILFGLLLVFIVYVAPEGVLRIFQERSITRYISGRYNAIRNGSDKSQSEEERDMRGD